jgi:hypothetical protein
MDSKITKKRLAHMLSYDWVKVIGAIVVAIVVWTLIFTMTATRITNTQRFVVTNYLGARYGNAMTATDFSYEIIEAERLDSLRGGENMFNDIYNSNIAVGDGDVMFVPNYPVSRQAKVDEQGNEMKDGDGNVIYEVSEDTYMEQALRRSFSSFTRLDDTDAYKGYFTQMKEYLAKFYTKVSEESKTFGPLTVSVATFDKDSLNKTAAEEAFRARNRANKDKRFKKESQIAEGVQKEFERMQMYLDAYNTFFEYAEKGYVSFTDLTVDVTDTFTASGVYGINLCPNETKMGSLKEQFYYLSFDELVTAKDMNVMFMSLEGLDTDFQYENLLFVNSLIKSVCTDLK